MIKGESQNPDDFIISRKRKKYRFALFHNSPLCFEHDEWDESYQPTILEIGAGTGLFSVEQAKRYPDETVTAVDVKADRLQTGAQIAEAEKLQNIRFLRTRADLLLEIIKPHTLKSIWITFPDPFPKERSAKNRLTHPKFLSLYNNLLHPDGKLHFKTDSRDLFLWSLEQLVREGWQIDELSFDLHESDLSDNYKVMTTYEKRWTSEGIVTNFVRAHRPLS